MLVLNWGLLAQRAEAVGVFELQRRPVQFSEFEEGARFAQGVSGCLVTFFVFKWFCGWFLGALF